MKKNLIIAVILLAIVGNVYQMLNPRVEVKIETVETIKWKTKVDTEKFTVKVTDKDGTITETTRERTKTETDKDIFSESKTETKPIPLPNNRLYLGMNMRDAGELQLIYTRNLIGPLDLYTAGTINIGSAILDTSNTNLSIHAGFGIKF